MPVITDLEETQGQFDLLADFILTNFGAVIGSDTRETTMKLAPILSEAFEDKYYEHVGILPEAAIKTKEKISESVKFLLDEAGPDIRNIFK
jgi:hypothetical protein